MRPLRWDWQLAWRPSVRNVTEMAMWELHYLVNQAERSSAHATKVAALQGACAIRQRYEILYIKGPGEERIEKGAIVAWCVGAKL
jgi:hypothetical protein